MTALTKNSISLRNVRSIFGRSLGFNRLLTVLLISLSVSACGFHLRGNIPLPEGFKNMFVKAPEGTFTDELEDILINAGAEITATQNAADVILMVMTANTRRDVGTLDERGLANSYNLTFAVRYKAVDHNGEVIRPVSVVRERRSYDFDPTLVVETESEERELQEDMEQDVALKIVRQLSTITNFKPSATAAEATATEATATEATVKGEADEAAKE